MAYSASLAATEFHSMNKLSDTVHRNNLLDILLTYKSLFSDFELLVSFNRPQTLSPFAEPFEAAAKIL